MKKIVFKFERDLMEGILIRRYKRFLADIYLNNNNNSNESNNNNNNEKDIITVHCPNTGSLLTVINQINNNDNNNDNNLISQSQQLCILSNSNNLKRKYQYTLEMIQVDNVWVGIHSALANKIVLNALRNGFVSECQGYSSLSTEFKSKDCKIDFQLIFDNNNNNNNNINNNNNNNNNNVGNNNDNEEKEEKEEKDSSNSSNKSKENQNKRKREVILSNNKSQQMLLEVKSVTFLNNQSSIAEFPDCVSTRATKHANHLIEHVRQGGRSTILFLIQRDDAESFTISHLDPDYQRAIHEAYLAGVNILPYVCKLCPEKGEIYWLGRIPFIDSLTS